MFSRLELVHPEVVPCFTSTILLMHTSRFLPDLLINCQAFLLQSSFERRVEFLHQAKEITLKRLRLGFISMLEELRLNSFSLLHRGLYKRSLLHVDCCHFSCLPQMHSLLLKVFP